MLAHYLNMSGTGHQFEYQPILVFGGSENDLVNGFFFDDFPS